MFFAIVWLGPTRTAKPEHRRRFFHLTGRVGPSQTIAKIICVHVTSKYVPFANSGLSNGRPKPICDFR